MSQTAKPPKNEREAKLAAALRQNLRRRKTADRQSPKPAADDDRS